MNETLFRQTPSAIKSQVIIKFAFWKLEKFVVLIIIVLLLQKILKKACSEMQITSIFYWSSFYSFYRKISHQAYSEVWLS